MGKKSARRKGRRRRRRRRIPWYFRLVLILLPFVLLALVEGLFRLVGIGQPPALFLERQLGTRTYLQPNPQVGGRFFPPSLASVMPQPNFQVLPAEKPEGTTRILCLGESTTAGFPFPVHGSFPALLGQILEERAPDRRWEVTNCGLTAISSSSVAETIDELLATDPDVLVVYLGHNEFYGAGGVASQRTGIGRSVTLLRKLYLVRWIESVLPRPDRRSEPGTLMQRIVRTATVSPVDPMREKAFDSFQRNLQILLDAARAEGVQVVLCEVVSNERDLYPLGCVGALETSLGGMGLAVARWPLGRPTAEEARKLLPALEEEVERDSLHAGLFYLRGQARLALADSAAAPDLRAARNLDAVPFRAPDPINEIIGAEAAGRDGILLVPVDSIFRAEAIFGIPGEESFVEHLHPAFIGNARIASAIADRLLGRPLERVVPTDAGRWLRGSGLSRLDLALADARIAQLLSRWPYKRTGDDAAPFAYHARSVRQEAVELLQAAGDSAGAAYFGAGEAEEEGIVRALLSHRIDLLEAHRQLARTAADRGDLERAARELDSAARLFPVDASLWSELGELRWKLGDREGAAEAARTALAWNPTSSAALDLLRRAETPGELSP